MKPMLKRIVVLALFAGLAVVLLAFQGILFRPEHPSATIVHAAADPAAGRARVERRSIPRVELHPGFVEAVDPAAVAPRVMATVVALDAREGDAVTAGQRLATLDDRDARARVAQAQAVRSAAEAQAVQARLAFERAERLLAAEAATRADWEAARAARDGAEAQVERAGEGLREAEAALSWFVLEAPFDGRVLERLAEPGQLAVPGRPIVVLYRADRLRVAVAVPAELARGLAPGAALEVELDAAPARTERVERTARLERVLPPADPRTGTVTLHLALEPADDLRPGLLARLRLPTGERSALVVPAAAVERIGQIERVRLVRDGRVVPVSVKTGKRHGEMLEVLSGLEEGEEVLVP